MEWLQEYTLHFPCKINYERTAAAANSNRRNRNNNNSNSKWNVWIYLKWANYLSVAFSVLFFSKKKKKTLIAFFPFNPFSYLTHHIFKVQTRLWKTNEFFFSLSLSRSLLLLLLLLLLSMSLSLFGYIHGILFSRWYCVLLYIYAI